MQVEAASGLQYAYGEVSRASTTAVTAVRAEVVSLNQAAEAVGASSTAAANDASKLLGDKIAALRML